MTNIKKIIARVILGLMWFGVFYNILIEPAKEFGWLNTITFLLLIMLVAFIMLKAIWSLLDLAFGDDI